MSCHRGEITIQLGARTAGSGHTVLAPGPPAGAGAAIHSAEETQQKGT